MTAYMNGFNTETYMFSKDGRIFSPKNNDSKSCIAAFLDIVGRSDDLGCIVDEAIKGSIVSVKATHVDTMGEAVLSINCGGLHGYHAKIMLGGEQLSVHGGPETAIRKIVSYLKAPKPAEKKTPTRKVPVLNREDVGAEAH